MKSKILTKISQFFRGDSCLPAKKEADSVKNTPNTEEFERCVMCGALTCVPISMPVDWRENYEIGCGQICAECAKKQRESAERENMLTSAQILRAVEQSRKDKVEELKSKKCDAELR
jgi:hypothetical protein